MSWREIINQVCSKRVHNVFKRGIECSILRLGVGPCGSASTFFVDKMELPLPAMCVIPFGGLGRREEVA